ncbi:MAG: hypothetical protein WC968_04250 [Bacilli bacterium]
MAELKGQLLGIILVILSFVAIGSVLVTNFEKSATDLTQQESAALSEINMYLQTTNITSRIIVID